MILELLQNLECNDDTRTDAVLISYEKFDGLEEIHKVDQILHTNIPADIGFYDGHEINMDDTGGCFFVFGNNAEELFKRIKPLLLEFEFLKDANVYLEFTKGLKAVSNLELKLND